MLKTIGTEVVGKFYEDNGGSPAEYSGTERSGSPSTKYPTTEEGD